MKQLEALLALYILIHFANALYASIYTPNTLQKTDILNTLSILSWTYPKNTKLFPKYEVVTSYIWDGGKGGYEVDARWLSECL